MPGGRKADERQAENDRLPTKVLATAESLGTVNTRPGDAWERGCCEPRARNLLMGPVTMMGRRVETGGGEVCGSLREVARKARYVTVVGGIRTADRRENLFIVRPGEKKTAPVLAAHSWTAALLNGLWKTPERRSWADRGADQNIWSSRAAGLGCQSTVKARKHGCFFLLFIISSLHTTVSALFACDWTTPTSCITVPRGAQLPSVRSKVVEARNHSILFEICFLRILIG